MPVALLTGTRPQLGSAATTVARAGFDVLTWAADSAVAPGEGPFDCYVQLPCAADPRAATDLVCRIDTLAAVAERLRPNASILLGVEPDGIAPDLLAAVAQAVLEDLGRSATRLAVLPVADLCRPPELADAQWEMPTPPLVSAP